MNCENLQFNLSLYADYDLTADERGALDAHLAQCPLCRQKLDDYQSLRNDLRGLARPAMPKNLLASLRKTVAAQLQSTPPNFEIFPSHSFGEWLKIHLMPLTVGVATSVVVGSMLLFSMLSATQQNSPTEFAVEKRSAPTILTSAESPPVDQNDADLNASDYAQTRLLIAGQSPSVNPHGALVAMTKAFVRGKMKDDEVVVVADVLSSGLAQISEVVEPSRDRQAVTELENALKNNPDYSPPFVPANMDGRSDTVRVIFKIQTVNVRMNAKKRR